MPDVMKIIDEEMRKYSSKAAYLNNFYMNLPDNTYEHGGYYRDLAVEVRNMDKSQLEDGADLDEEVKLGHSELFLNQKMRDFFDTVDKVLVEEGISIDEVKKLQKLGRKDFSKIKELYELVFPAYVRLRDMGYTHADLIA